MTAETLPFERLQVIWDDVPREGALNMALDEALLHGLGSLPLLRFYRWVRPTVTFGYFEPAESARRVARGREIVRRLTGGGIVEHGNDLTFTLVVPRGEPFAQLRSAESYRQIHAALAWALERSGLVSQTHGDAPSNSPDERHPNACFERPVLHDLMIDGRKIAGGAQRRTRLGLIHQGSIQPGRAPDLFWRATFICELPLALARHHEKRALVSQEVTRARTLAAAKYATPAWTNRV